jgi:hypothetical protein
MQRKTADVKVESLETETVWLTQMTMAELYRPRSKRRAAHEEYLRRKRNWSKDSVVKKILLHCCLTESSTVHIFIISTIHLRGYRVKTLLASVYGSGHQREGLLHQGIRHGRRTTVYPPWPVPHYDISTSCSRRIRDIVTANAACNLPVKEIFAMAGDYDPSWSGPEVHRVIQNKLHFAATHDGGGFDTRAGRPARPNLGPTAGRTGGPKDGRDVAKISERRRNRRAQPDRRSCGWTMRGSGQSP